MIKWLKVAGHKDIKLKELKQIAKERKLKLLRNADKDSHILAIAANLLMKGDCTLAENISLDRVVTADVTVA